MGPGISFCCTLGNDVEKKIQTLSVSARVGLLYPLNPSCETLFNDRFQMGGPFSLRSFKNNSMGPRDGGLSINLFPNNSHLHWFLIDNSLGGEIYWSVGASIIGDIPHKPHWPVKTQLFVNLGRLDMVNRCTRHLQYLIFPFSPCQLISMPQQAPTTRCCL